MTRFIAAVDRLGTVLAAIAMVFLLVLVGDMVYEVVSRRLFDAPTLWAYDIAYMVNASGFVMAAGYALRHNAHIRIDFLSTRLAQRTQDWINVVVYVLLIFPSLGALIVGCWWAFLRAWNTHEVDPASPWKPVLWPFYGALLIGFSAFFLQALAECIRHVRSIRGLGPSPLLETPHD